MPLPLAPIAGMAARYGAVALVAYAASRRINKSQTSQASEDALDQVPEGLSTHRPQDRQQVNGALRWRRVVRAGANGPGIEIDITALGRIKFRAVPNSGKSEE
ncbi:MAG: hypothetical protein GXP03_05835 [Alphaproteobacteria bacterium]|nr:hypothetical protein [Alphaproteobacteria bacterium]